MSPRLAGFLLAVLLGPAARADDLSALIAKCVRGSDEARLAVIDAGLPAIPELVEVMRTETGVPAERASHALGWIAEFAGRSPARARAEWALVNLLLDRSQPLLARQTAARRLWHVASEDSVAVLQQVVADPDLATEALFSLGNIPGPRAIRALAETYATTRGETQAALVETLGRRPDAPIDVLTAATAGGNARVRLAALAGLGRKADVSVAAFLAERIERTTGDERAAALAAYVSVGDGLRQSGDTDAARRIYEKALQAGGQAVEAAIPALEGLGQVGTERSAAVVGPFLRSADPGVQVAAAGALARLPGAEPTRVLAAQLPGATLQQARPILSALAERPDTEAAEAAIPFARAQSPDVRILALTVLGRAGDRASCEVILENYQNPDLPEQVHWSAFEAYRLVGQAQLRRGDRESARAILESALQMAGSDGQASAALRALAQVASPQSLPAVLPKLRAEGPVQEAAAMAVLAIADGLALSGDRKAAIDALTKALDAVPAGPLSEPIVGRLGALGSTIDAGSRNGYVTHWAVIGPFPSDGDYGGTDTVTPIEQMLGLDLDQPFGEQKLTWKHQHTLDPEGIVEYIPLFEPHENVFCYAYAEVTLKQDVEARLHAGSDDSLVVWLNGEEVHRFKGPRGLKVGQDKRDIRLKAGPNRILIKVVQGPGDWSSSLRLTDRSDQPLSFEQKAQ
jgi:HEAT repeat protein